MTANQKIIYTFLQQIKNICEKNVCYNCPIRAVGYGVCSFHGVPVKWEDINLSNLLKVVDFLKEDITND